MQTPTLTLKRARKLRRELTLPEVLIWQRIRGRKLHGLHFRRQHPIGPYILDFYCASVRLALEIDGASHEHRVDHDRRRDAWLASRDIRVMRFSAIDVLSDRTLESVLDGITQAAAPSTAFGGSPPPLRGGGT